MKRKASAKKIGKADDANDDADAKCLFPMNRIKMLAKSEGGDDMRLSHEAIFLLNKACVRSLTFLKFPIMRASRVFLCTFLWHVVFSTNNSSGIIMIW